MYCGKCGKEINGRNYCEYCGEKIGSISEKKNDSATVSRKKNVAIVALFVIILLVVLCFMIEKLIDRQADESDKKENFVENEVSITCEKKLVRVEYYQWDVLERIQEYEYDDNDKLIKETTNYTNEESSSEFVSVYEYNKKGELLSSVTYNENGEEVCDVEYEYLEDGTVRYVLCQVDGSRQESLNDELGNLLMMTSYDTDGRAVCSSQYEYDNRGNVIHSITKNYGEVVDENTFVNSYGVNGKILKAECSDGSVIEYKYDDRNNLIQISYVGTHFEQYYVYDENNLLLEYRLEENGYIRFVEKHYYE